MSRPYPTRCRDLKPTSGTACSFRTALPPAIVQKLNAGLNAALVSPQVSARFAELNIESRQNTPAEFGAYVASQMELWSRVVKEANIKLG